MLPKRKQPFCYQTSRIITVKTSKCLSYENDACHWLGSEHKILRRRLSTNPDCCTNREYLCQNHTSCHEKCSFIPSKPFFSFPEICVVDKSFMSDWKCKCRKAASPFLSDRSKSLFFPFSSFAQKVAPFHWNNMKCFVQDRNHFCVGWRR